MCPFSIRAILSTDCVEKGVRNGQGTKDDFNGRRKVERRQMIDLKGMISINLLKKEAFTGSEGKLRFRLHKEKTEEKDVIRASYWMGPYCWEMTEEDEKTSRDFEFTTDGIWEAVNWLNNIVGQMD